MRRKRNVIVACLILLTLAIIPSTLAWFNYQKKLTTVTMINDPNALYIGAGNKKDIKELVIGNIDVSTTGSGYKDVVFCVYGYKASAFQLQLAHTTNIGFQYTIYPADLGATDGALQIMYLGETYSFHTEFPLEGDYINRDASTNLAQQTGEYHDTTYKTTDGSYSQVQNNAEPLYWKTTNPQRLNQGENGVWINYYVLRISWDQDVVNNKETDMVYLMAETDEFFQ